MISRQAAVVAPGLMVLAIILFMGAVSGAHLNPAVSLAFALRGDFPWKRLPGYIVVQLIGATLAGLFLHAVINVSAKYGSNYPAPNYSSWSAFWMEVVLTFGLVNVILGTASGAQNLGVIGALGVGSYIALAGLWGSPISGASMNPSRTFGPDLVSGNFTDYWVYVAGPIAGAAIAVGIAYVLRGPGGDRGEIAAAQGALFTDALQGHQGTNDPGGCPLARAGPLSRLPRHADAGSGEPQDPQERPDTCCVPTGQRAMPTRQADELDGVDSYLDHT